MEAKELPHFVDAENSVLCSMMTEEEAALKAMEIVTAEDFYSEGNKVIFRAIKNLIDKGQKADMITLEAELETMNVLEDVGGLQRLIYLNKYQPTTAQVVQHAKIVKEASKRRQLLRLGKAMIDNSVGEENTEAQLEAAQKGLNAISEQSQTSGPEQVTEIVKDYINYVSNLKLDEDGLTGIATHYEELDKITNGLNKSDFIVLAARPSMGKTAMALNIVENIILHADKDYHIALFSLEMSRQQLVSRMLSNITGLDNHRMNSNQLSDEEWQRVWEAADFLNEKKFYIDDTPGLTVTQLRTRAKRLAKAGLDLIVIDYLQLMDGNKTHSSDRQQQIAEISRSLKALARELNVPVIALSQLSRSVENRQLKRPILSDIRDSGSIEQDADLVIFMYRDDYYYYDSKEPGVTELIIAKHRNGPIGSIKFLFEKQYTKFVQLL